MTAYLQPTNTVSTNLLSDGHQCPAKDFYAALVASRKVLAESRDWRKWECRRKKVSSSLLDDSEDPVVEQHMKLEVSPMKLEEPPMKEEPIATFKKNKRQPSADTTKQQAYLHTANLSNATRKQKWKFFKSAWKLHEKTQYKTKSRSAGTKQTNKNYQMDAPSMPLEIVVAGCMEQEENMDKFKQPEEPEQSESCFMAAIVEDTTSPFSRSVEC